MHSPLLSCALAALLCCPLGLLAAEEQALPRYDLPVGRKLTYSTSGETKDAGGTSTDRVKGTFTVTVLRENPDGSRRVALRSASTFISSGAGGSESSHDRVTVAYADVFPDGRSAPNESLGMMIDPAAVLPLLPADAARLAQGWASPPDAPQPSKYVAKTVADGADGTFVFVGEQTGVMNKIYERTHRGTHHFDREKGAIARIESEVAQGYGFKMKGTGETKLASDETIPLAEVATLAADFDRLFDTQRHYTATMQDVLRDPAKADELLESAKAQIAKGRDEMETDAARAEFDRLLKDHENYAKYAKDEAERFAKVLNKPSPQWNSTDIDGRPAAMADYRGKVVVLDFWYRGCGWCIYAMPQIMQLTSDYAAKPVVVLGMNTDRKEPDARFVVDTLGLNYLTIKAQGIPEKYGVQGFPTLVIIDQAGIVRDVHVGYSPTLRENVAKKVDALLKEPSKPAAS